MQIPASIEAHLRKLPLMATELTRQRSFSLCNPAEQENGPYPVRSETIDNSRALTNIACGKRPLPSLSPQDVVLYSSLGKESLFLA